MGSPAPDAHWVCARAGGTAAVPFRPCVLSWLFFWHVVWLSVMQLRHYLFIGTLNPLLDHLARGDASLGRARRPRDGSR